MKPYIVMMEDVHTIKCNSEELCDILNCMLYKLDESNPDAETERVQKIYNVLHTELMRGNHVQ